MRKKTMDLHRISVTKEYLPIIELGAYSKAYSSAAATAKQLLCANRFPFDTASRKRLRRQPSGPLSASCLMTPFSADLPSGDGAQARRLSGSPDLLRAVPGRARSPCCRQDQDTALCPIGSGSRRRADTLSRRLSNPPQKPDALPKSSCRCVRFRFVLQVSRKGDLTADVCRYLMGRHVPLHAPDPDCRGRRPVCAA